MVGLTQDKSQLQFLELLRAGLWGKSADETVFTHGTDWKTILSYARMQAVTPLVYEGIITLPQELRPEMKQMFQLMAFVDKIEKLNEDLDRAAADLSEKFAAEGIKTVLLKGQGNATYYLKPGRRQCGDIDLYAGCGNYEKGKELIRKWYPDAETVDESKKHEHYNIGGTIVELHRIAFELSLTSEDFRKWEDSRVGGTESSVTLAGKKVFVPETTFNAFFIFAHAFHHFMTSGIGLRQLCDLTVFLTGKKDDIDGEELRKQLKLHKLEKEWAFFVRLCAEDLGLAYADSFASKEELAQAGSKAVKFHDFIFAEGNFGHWKKGKYYMDKPYLIRKSISFVKHNVRYFHRFSISPGQTLTHWWTTVVDGIKAVLKRK